MTQLYSSYLSAVPSTVPYLYQISPLWNTSESQAENIKVSNCQDICFCLGCYNRILQTEWLINNKFISYSSRGWEAQDQGTSRSDVWWGSYSWFLDGFLLKPHMVERERELSGISFIRAHINSRGTHLIYNNFGTKLVHFLLVHLFTYHTTIRFSLGLTWI